MTVHWGEKRYYSLDYYLKKTYGEKLYKISLDGGMTCPNRDGTLGTHGCIFCSRGGSGDFAASRTLSVTEQIEAGKQQSAKKYTGSSYIAYFQAYTNTYASLEYLETLYMEAITHPDIRILSIATRPDCLSEKILDLLENLNQSGLNLVFRLFMKKAPDISAEVMSFRYLKMQYPSFESVESMLLSIQSCVFQMKPNRIYSRP